METFRIDSPFEKQNFIRLSLVRWKIHWLKNRGQLIYMTIASLIILVLGFLARSEEEPTNPFIFIGIGLAACTLFVFYIRLFSRRRYIRKIQDIAERFDAIKMDCTYEFSDESIKYWDKEKKLEFKWSMFTNYSIYKNYLVIILNSSLIESYLFEKKESEIEEYNRILEFVKLKLEHKVIK